MDSSRTPQLNALARMLEMRLRLKRFFRYGTATLAVAFGASMLATVATIAFTLELPLVRLVTIAVGMAIAAALLAAAATRIDPARLLIDADRRYETKSLLISGYQFGNEPAVATHEEQAFRDAVIEQAEKRSNGVKPEEVYPFAMPRMASTAAALFVALAIGMVLELSGWFDQVAPPVTEQSIAIEDAGQRLAERATDNEALRELAEEMQRLGQALRENQIPGDEARRRIEELGRDIEEQIRNLERTRPFETEEQELPPRAEETVRRALERGMSRGEVMDFFTRMRAEGETMPDMIDALEEATPDRAPDTNLGLERDQMDELIDQLNRPPPSEDADSDIVNELEESQRIVEQTGQGLAELSQGEDNQVGAAAEEGVSRGGGSDEEREEQPDSSGQSQSGTESEGQQGGDAAVADATGDDFTRIEDASPIFRELDGIVTNDTIMDIIIREMPSEATSQLNEQERDAAFERVIEQAMEREQLPPEAQRLVRNYFLRITRMNQNEENNEQSE
ncbi:MAG: hypothetical protein ACLFP4_05770 [Spirochaetales bacterium]